MMDRWISVSDRLPDGDCQVLTYRPDRSLPILTETYYGGHWGGDVAYLAPVTHWMPLPESPAPKRVSKDWISVKDKPPEMPCVIWNGQSFDLPSNLLVRKYDGEMKYYDTALIDGTDKEISARDLSQERDIKLWMPLLPLPEGVTE